MDEVTLRRLLTAVQSGETSADDAVRELKRMPFAEMGFAKIDHHRPLRQLLPEAIYGPGKSPQHCAAIVEEMLSHGTGPVLLTRADEPQIRAALATSPGGRVTDNLAVWRPAAERPGRIVVLTAGTADLPVATECMVTLEAQGFRPRLIADVGVAGVHRLLSVLDELTNLDALVVVAGMEGALASIAGGITPAPVVAVPTSVGYGAGLQGITALLSMLAGCAAGTTVVGIDNGFGAACAVTRILNGQSHDDPAAEG